MRRKLRQIRYILNNMHNTEHNIVVHARSEQVIVKPQGVFGDLTAEHLLLTTKYAVVTQRRLIPKQSRKVRPSVANYNCRNNPPDAVRSIIFQWTANFRELNRSHINKY